MTPVNLHIEYLIQRHDCVILPGIGAIVVDHQSARIDEVRGVIIPPQRIFSFNPLICHDDGMLANSIARRDGINFEAARSLLLSEMASLKNVLNNDGEYTIPKIGNLSLNEEKNIIFTPISSSHYNSALMGYSESPISLPIPVGKEGDVITPGISSVISAKNNSSYQKFSDKNYYIPVNKIFAKIAAALIVILTIAWFAITTSLPANQSPIVEASVNPVRSITNDDINQNPPPPLTTLADDDNDNYTLNSEISHLIVATFHSGDEADRFIESRNGGNYDLKIVKGKNVWRISACRGDKTTLLTILNSAEFKAAFSEAWIWTG